MFREVIAKSNDVFDVVVTKSLKESGDNINDKIEKIRKENIKIKTIHPTKFGFEVLFYNEEDAKGAADLINSSDIDGKSIFISKK